MTAQHEITTPSPLLTPAGRLSQVGWARQPLLDCNLAAVRFFPSLMRPLQRFRLKRWDYYGVTTPDRFFSVTLADLGYAGQAFVYTIDFASGHYHEETVTILLSRGLALPRNSTEGESRFEDGKVSLSFQVEPDGHRLQIHWPDFAGQSLTADITLRLAPDHESTVIVIPIAGKRFYYNRKINCLPAKGWLQVGDQRTELQPDVCLGNLDWGRGVWEYRSFWVRPALPASCPTVARLASTWVMVSATLHPPLKTPSPWPAASTSSARSTSATTRLTTGGPGACRHRMAGSIWSSPPSSSVSPAPTC